MPARLPNPAYEHAHLISRDLLDDIQAQLAAMLHPDHKSICWKHVHTMNAINAKLSEVAATIDQVNNHNR